MECSEFFAAEEVAIAAWYPLCLMHASERRRRRGLEELAFGFGFDFDFVPLARLRFRLVSFIAEGMDEVLDS